MNKLLIIFLLSVIISGCSIIKVDKGDSKMNKSIKTENKIELYAKLKAFSSSGGMKFYYYDFEKRNNTKGISGNDWFWGGVYEDNESINSFVKYIEEDKNAIFKITGNQFEDDCDYMNGFCFENIKILKIERIK